MLFWRSSCLRLLLWENRLKRRKVFKTELQQFRSIFLIFIFLKNNAADIIRFYWRKSQLTSRFKTILKNLSLFEYSHFQRHTNYWFIGLAPKQKKDKNVLSNHTLYIVILKNVKKIHVVIHWFNQIQVLYFKRIQLFWFCTKPLMSATNYSTGWTYTTLNKCQIRGRNNQCTEYKFQ
jgi:hypothetical protein